MKLYDPALSKNGVGRTEPPKTAHSGAPNPWVSCGSDIYEELWADIIGEIANAVTGAGITLDGTKRNQLFLAIQAISAASAPKAIVGQWAIGDSSASGTGWSMTRSATGRYVVTFSVAFSSATSYSCVANPIHVGGGVDLSGALIESGQTATVCVIRTQRNVNDFNEGVVFTATGT